MSLGEEKYYVQILGAASSEKVLLENSLQIGSDVELGLKVQHPHLSPEHCTVFLQSGVLSILDHNSDLGVTINGKKIPPNKMIIILPDDDVRIGDLILKIHCFEEEAISEDHTTRILSLDDLLKEESKEDLPAALDEVQESIKGKLDLEAPTDEEATSFKLNIDSQNVQPVQVATPVVAEEIKPVEEVKIVKSAVDPLAKFKRGGKLPDTQLDAVKNSQKNLKDFKKRSKKYYFSQFNSVSFPLRIFAFILDMIIGIRLSLYLIEIDAMDFFSPLVDFINFSFDFVFNLHPDTAYIATHLIGFSSYFVGYLLVRILGNLLFGASPGQLMIGCWNDGNFAIKRVLGPIREILGFVLAPLIVFDLPALFSKKTVKEMLTMTGLECYNKTLSYVLALTLIPTAIILGFFSPLFLQDFSKTEVSFSADSQKIQISQSLSSAKTTGSNFFRLNTSWNNKLFSSYLNFKQVQNKDKAKVYVPRITFYPLNLKEQLLIRLERKKEFIWGDQLDKMVKMYPVLANRFESFTNTKNKHSKDYSTQLKQVILDSFQLSPDTILSFILNYGPYIDPFLNFKNKLTKYFQGEVESIEFWKNADLDFMIVTTKSSDLAGRWRDFYILPLTKDKTYIYQCSYLKGTLPKTKLIMKQFLSLAKVQTSNEVNMKEWKGMILTSPELLDFYSLKSLSEKDKAAMSPFIYRYYWDNAKNAAVTTSELFWADYVNNLRTAVGMLSEMNIEARKSANPENDPLSDVGYDLLIKKLSFLREAIKNKQLNNLEVFNYP